VKTYEIEIKRTSFITLQIVAASTDEAEATALDIVEDENQTDAATYEIESTREQEQATDETRSNGPHQQTTTGA
jgi:hypothetical protein